MRDLLDHETLPMYAVSERLAPRIEAFGLQRNIEQMKRDGYTVLEPIAPPEFSARLRDTILALAGGDEYTPPGGMLRAYLLIGRDPVFAEAVTNPRLLAMVEYMCGQGALISQASASVRPQGEAFLKIHADQSWIPAPFPEHNVLLTACWVLDDYTVEAGCTKVIPGSHRLRRHPKPDESDAAEGSIPIECPPGSVALWDGSVWHGNYPRTIPGERVVLHLTYGRLAYRTIDDWSHLDDDFLADQPPEMATLLGRTDRLGASTLERGTLAQAVRFARTANMSKR